MVSNFPLISKSFNPLQSLWDCSKHANYIRSHHYLGTYLSFIFTLWYTRMTRPTVWQVLFFLLTITRSGCLGRIWWSVWISKSQNLVHFILQDGFWVVHIPLVQMVKFQFLAHFSVDHFPIQLCLVLYSFCTNLLHSLMLYSDLYHMTSSKTPCFSSTAGSRQKQKEK